MTLLKQILLLAVGAALLVSPIALAQEVAPTDLSVPRLAHETRAELTALGCDEVNITNTQALLAARSLSWEIVLPADALDQSVVLCSPAVISGLQPLREGRVEAAAAYAQITLPAGQTAQAMSTPTEMKLNPIASFLVWLLNALSSQGVKLLSAFLEAGIKLLAVKGFLSQAFVTDGWTVALGVANLGFMLALVVIALMVTLRLDNGGGVKRLLPRFLLGALLVNFSLIIGVAIIDFSRLVMALMLSFFGYGGPTELLTAFKVELRVSEIVINLGKFFAAITNEKSEWFGVGQVVAAMMLVLVVFALAGAALVVFAGLLIRWLVLAVLLVLSPFAYLFVAFPNTANLANMWWKQFLRYVFYAPVVLLILIATAKFAGSDDWRTLIAFDPAPSGEYSNETVKMTMADLIHKAAIAVGLMLAAGSGRWAGIVGSAAVMGAVSKAGARGKAVYLRGLRKGGKAAYIGTGTRRAAREGRAIFGKATEPIRRTMGLGAYSKFDEKGRLKKGKETVGRIGERLQRAVGYVTPGAGGKKQRQTNIDSKNMRDNIATPTAITHAALRNEEAGKALTSKEASGMTTAVAGAGDRVKTINLVSNVEIVRRMDAAAQAAVMGTGDIEIIKALNASLRRVANET